MSETQPTEETRPRWPWVLLVGGIVAIALIILGSVLLRDEPADLPIDEPAPTPGVDVDDDGESDVDDDPDETDADAGVQDPATAAQFAASWIADQVADDGSVEIGFSGPVGNAVQAGLALAAAGVGGDAFERIVGYVGENADSYLETPDGDAAGALGYTILLADAAGEDPRDFGGHDLVARVDDIRRIDGDDAGLYGAADPSWDGVFRQSLVLLGLVAAGVDPDDDAVAWLVDQQCEDGGWPSYRSPNDRADDECDQDEASADTNSTALAVQALAALRVEPRFDAAAWIAGAQNEDGGFGYEPGSPTDSNSTGLVAQAIVALGDDPDGGRWDRGGGVTPATALLELQIGCDGDSDAQGAFAYQQEDDGRLEPNPATFQATWGIAKAAFPLGERTLEDAVPQIC